MFPTRTAGSPVNQWTWYRSKNQNPNRNPGTEVADLANDWELIGTENDNDADYTPQGVDNDAGPARRHRNGRDLLPAGQGGSIPIRKAATDKAAVGVSANPVQADVANADNNSPDFQHNETNRMVPENASKGTPVLGSNGRASPVAVDRNEDRDTLTYQLDNDNNAANDVPLGSKMELQRTYPSFP